MIWRYTDGGYAEYVAVPKSNAVCLPDEIPFEHGAILMCSSSTAFHALRKSKLKGGETVAIFGVGGLGISAVQLAQVFGANDHLLHELPLLLELTRRGKLNLSEAVSHCAIGGRCHQLGAGQFRTFP